MSRRKTVATPRRDAHVRFRDALLSLNLTTGTAARALGCDRSFVSHLQLGSAKPGLRVAVAIEQLTAAIPGGPIRPRDWADGDGHPLEPRNAPPRNARRGAAG